MRNTQNRSAPPETLYKDRRTLMCVGLSVVLIIWAIGVVRLIMGLAILPEIAAMVVLVTALGVMRQRSMGPKTDFDHG